MSSKGSHHVAPTSDGSDHAHRETVKDHYKVAAKLKGSLRTAIGIQLGLYAAVAAAVALRHYVDGFETMLVAHPAFVPTGAAAVLAQRSVPKGVVGMMLCYATVAALSAAYLVGIPVGAAVQAAATGERSPLVLGVAAVHAILALCLLWSAYVGRQLITVWTTMRSNRKRG